MDKGVLCICLPLPYVQRHFGTIGVPLPGNLEMLMELVGSFLCPPLWSMSAAIPGSLAEGSEGRFRAGLGQEGQKLGNWWEGLDHSGRHQILFSHLATCAAPFFPWIYTGLHSWCGSLETHSQPEDLSRVTYRHTNRKSSAVHFCWHSHSLGWERNVLITSQFSPLKFQNGFFLATSFSIEL